MTSLILTGVRHPGNLGSCARLMSNFGWTDLRLVKCNDHLCPQAVKQATHGAAILQAAQIYPRLESALAGMQKVIGATSRPRSRLFKPLVSQQLGRLANTWPGLKLGLLLGNETSGLSNDELSLCQVAVSIPTPHRASLNISHAAAILLYELSRNQENQTSSDSVETKETVAEVQEVEALKNHWFALLDDIGFLHQAKRKSLWYSLSHVLAKANLSQKDVRILRAMVHKTCLHIHRLKNPGQFHARE